MGAYSSTHLTPEEIEELVNQTNFNSKEVEQLYHRFKKLDRSRSGVISQKDFQLLSELSLNPMSARILALFQSESGDSSVSTTGVTFDVFVKTLNVFHARTPVSVKLSKLFQAYDIDGDGVISERDLCQMLKYYVGPHLSDAACRVLVRRTMKNALARCGRKDGAEEKKSEVKKHVRNNSTSQTDETQQQVGLNFAEFERLVANAGVDALNVSIPIQS